MKSALITTEIQITTDKNISTLRLLNSGNGIYQSFYTDGFKLYHFITGGESCAAEHKDIICENFGINHYEIKEVYDCKKHNIIIKKLTGTTINKIETELNNLVNKIKY